jgi:biotin carboxyl carrier protein
MKVMNKISAEFSCKIVRKVAKNGQALRAGDVLFLVEKT